jgi:hypothetical protein
MAAKKCTPRKSAKSEPKKRQSQVIEMWEKVGNPWRAERARNREAKYNALEKERRKTPTPEKIEREGAAARSYRAGRVADAAQRHPNLSALRAYKMELAEAKYSSRMHVQHPEQETRTLCGLRFNRSRDSSFGSARWSLEYFTKSSFSPRWICARCIRGWERLLDAEDQRRVEELVRHYEYRTGLRALLHAAFGGGQQERSMNGETEMTQNEVSTTAPSRTARLPHRLETSLIQQRRPFKEWLNAARRHLGPQASHADLAAALFGSLEAIRHRAPETHDRLLQSAVLWHEREGSREESEE